MKPIMIADHVAHSSFYFLERQLNSNFGGIGSFKLENNSLYWIPRQEHVLNEKFETRIFWFVKGFLAGEVNK